MAGDHVELDGSESAEDKAGWLSRLFFQYLTPVMKQGKKRPLEESDMLGISENDRAEHVGQLFQNSWDREVKEKGKDASAVRALHHAYGKPFYMAGVLKFIYDVMTFLQPIFINMLLMHLASNEPSYIGYIWVGALFLTMFLQSFLINAYFFRVMRSGMHARTGLITAIYHKALLLSNSARQGMSIGEITTLMSIDTSRIEGLCAYLHIVWSGVLQIIVALSLLFWLLGPSVFAGFILMVCLLPAQHRITALLGKIRKETVKHTDSRINTMNEVMQGIRVIKYFAWEESFLNALNEIRAREIVQVRKSALVRAANTALLMLSPVLVALVTFLTYAGTGNELTPAKVFTALILFNILRFPLMMVPMVVAGVAEARVSLVRMSKFLNSDELQPVPLLTASSKPNVSLLVEDGEFYWSKDAKKEVKKEEKKETKSSKNPLKMFKRKSQPQSKSPKNAPDDEEAEDAVRLTLHEGAEDEENPNVPKSSSQDDLSGTAPLKSTLRNISFAVPTGKLYAVVGTVGSGKSSLLSAILGEMTRVKGKVEVVGSRAFVPQEAWIQNATLRDNILFGQAVNESRYKTAIDVCSLDRDLTQLPAGDKTEIGEKGISLSGGQKQRVSLARAVYADADVYLLDDCLSAVDSHVGRHIFEKCIVGALKDKTRILVTHQLQYVSAADVILVMHDGEIIERGSYAELMAKKDSVFFSLMSHYAGHDDNEAPHSPSNASASAPSSPTATAGTSPTAAATKVGEKTAAATAGKAEPKKGQLMHKEERETGAVSKHVVGSYISASGGITMLALIIFLYALMQAFRVSNDLWLSMWSTDEFNLTVHQYMLVFGLLALGSALAELTRGFTFAHAGVRASINLHRRAVSRVIRGTMAYFDGTPVGRIMSRMKDVDGVDNGLPGTLQSFLNTFATVIVSMLVVCIVLPLFIVPLVPMLVVYYMSMQYYRHSSRELKRLDSLSRSPLFSHFSESLGGLATIRAYFRQESFQEVNASRLERNLRTYWTQSTAQRWLSIRLELLAAVFVFFVALFVVLGRGSLSPGLAGLVLMYSQAMTGLLNWTVRMATDSEASMNSVERLLFLAENVPQEAPAVAPTEDARLPRDWPASGSLKFESVTMAYREDREPVLRDVSFVVQPREKVGVVGRTGAGKSSLMVALYRMAEISDGRIMIDGVDVSRIGLNALRTRALAIIPQDPHLFSGTVRSNLDPFREYSDDELWRALERSHLKKCVEGLPLKLEAPCTEYGQNFSVGQRQLFCLARAMLRKARILVLDEATASVDVQSDKLIQETIRTEFSHCTVLSIAHRLNTIVDYDKVLVMDAGRVAEFGSPAELLDNPNGIFYSMVEQTGPATARHLHQLARGAAAAQVSPSESGRSASSSNSSSVKGHPQPFVSVDLS